MTIKFGNFANFVVRNFVVIWEAPNLICVRLKHLLDDFLRGCFGPFI